MKKIVAIFGLLTTLCTVSTVAHGQVATSFDLMKITEDLTSKAWDAYHTAQVADKLEKYQVVMKIGGIAMIARLEAMTQSQNRNQQLAKCSGFAQGYSVRSSRINELRIKLIGELSDSARTSLNAENEQLQAQQEANLKAFNDCI